MLHLYSFDTVQFSLKKNFNSKFKIKNTMKLQVEVQVDITSNFQDAYNFFYFLGLW